MDKDRLFAAIKASKEYGGICDETILRIIDMTAPKYKSEKLVLKSVKSTLREISAAFLNEGDLREAAHVLNEIQWDDPNDIKTKTARILMAHQSTKERAGFITEMIGDIQRETGFRTVLDIGCGFNPFVIPHVDYLNDAEYHAMDIHSGAIDLIKLLFAGLNICGSAFSGDVLVKTPDIRADCVFLFKLLPLLERLEKDAASRVLSGLNSPAAAISFPTRSFSGRNVGMKASYTAFMREKLCAFPIIFEKEYVNEILFITLRRKNTY